MTITLRMFPVTPVDASTNRSRDDRLELEGGLSQTGRPAELVRVRNGKTMAIDTHRGGRSTANGQAMKRSLSMEASDDDGVSRSMARRKKSAPIVPKDIPQKCRDCDKTFKRPCDLT